MIIKRGKSHVKDAPENVVKAITGTPTDVTIHCLFYIFLRIFQWNPVIRVPIFEASSVFKCARYFFVRSKRAK